MLSSPQVQNDPIINNPYSIVYGLIPSYSSATILQLTPGNCRDINNVIDMGLGSNFPNLAGTVSLNTVINTAVAGAGGVDTGVIVPNSMYAIYLIGDSTYRNPVAPMISLNQSYAPLLPFGYDSLRIIGYWPVSGGGQFLQGWYTPLGPNHRMFTYGSRQLIVSSSGATTLTFVNCNSFLPMINNCHISLQCYFVAAAANDQFAIYYSSTGVFNTYFNAPVAGSVAALTEVLPTLAQIVSGNVGLSYLVSNAADQLSLGILSFQMAI